tara:strand:- start:3789 stop:4397 length:609 start_codon:yes stop_codon:yes gene_type:complete
MIGVSLFLPLIVNASDASSVHEDHPYQFKVRNNPGHYAFVRHKISSPVKDTYPGDILALGSTLLLYKKPYCKEDAFQATGVVRAEQWILWKDPWAKSIDIFDSDNVKIGMIEHESSTFGPTTYYLYTYDSAGNTIHIGTALVKKDFSQITIDSSDSSATPITKLYRQGETNDWLVFVYYPDQIDDRIIRIFSGFVVECETSL